jgi:hypothetical protein
MVPENEAVVRRFMDELWSEGQLSVADELVAPDHVHHLGDDTVRGRMASKKPRPGFGPRFPICASRSTS